MSTVRVDRVGRLVIPKALRERVGIHGECELEVTVDGGGLHLEVVAPRHRPIETVDGLPLLGPPAAGAAQLTDELVAQLRDDQR